MSDVATIIIVPEPDRFNSVARQLLDIVGNDRATEVAVVTYPHYGFRVPEDVAVEYARRTAPQPSQPLVQEPEEPAVVPELVAAEPARPRRRGSKKSGEVQ